MRYAMAFALALGLSAPVMAQTTAPSATPSTGAASLPTRDQCQSGYKTDMSVRWTKDQFDRACADMMKK